MNMSTAKLLMLCLCCLMVAPAAWGQAASNPAKPGILGYLDPRTGAFRPVPPADDAGELPTLTTFTGTVSITITVTVKTTGITNVICSSDVLVEDSVTSSPRIYSEGDTVTATGTGTTKSCKLSIPYSWALATQASDTMTTSYSVIGTASTTTPYPSRTSSLSPLDSRKVPTSGTTTLLTASATI
jgi:hypothetical protein